MQHEHVEALIRPALAILRDRQELGETVHLHGPVAHQREHRTRRVRELRCDRVGHAGPHRRERARERAHHPLAQPDVARVPVGRRARVGRDDRPIGQALGQLGEEQLGVDPVRALGRALVHQLPPVGHVRLDLLAPGAIRLAREQRQQLTQRLLSVTDEPDLERIAHAEHARVDVDLDRLRLAHLGQELRVREARADHQQRVAALHQLPRRARAEQADRSRAAGHVVGHGRLAEQGLGDAGCEQVGRREHLLRRAERAGADQHGDALARVQHARRPPRDPLPAAACGAAGSRGS